MAFGRPLPRPSSAPCHLVVLRNGHKFTVPSEQGKALAIRVSDLLTSKSDTVIHDDIRGVCFALSDVVAIHPEADAR